MLRELSRGADKVIFTRSSLNPRAMDPDQLAARFAEIGDGTMMQAKPDLREAVNAAARGVQPQDLILITGSFYLAGEAKGLFEQKKARGAAGGAAR
jgi:folylpolyglutamate synthase/dihydropteroate synthase